MSSAPPPSIGGARRPGARLLPGLALLLLLAAAVRVRGLGAASFWLDEVVSVAIAGADLHTFVKVVGSREANMLLYYGILRVWVAVFGDGEAAVRALSTAVAVATVPVVFALGRRLFGRPAGWTAGLLLALNAAHVHYAQEARGYALAALLAALSTLALVRALDAPSRLRWGVYAGVTALAAYAHFFAALVLAAHWAVVPWLHGRRPPAGLVASTAAVALAWVPIALFVLLKDAGQVGWIRAPSAADVRGALALLGGGALPLAGQIVAAGWAVVALSRGRWPAPPAPGGARAAWPLALCAAWLIVPIGLALLVSAVKPLFVARYLLVSLPALPLLAGAGVAALPRRAPRVAAAGTLAALAIVGLQRGLMVPRQDWRGATYHVLARAAPEDAVVFHPPWMRRAFDHYAGDHAGAAPRLAHPPRWDYAYFVRGGVPEVRPDSASLAALPCRHPRVWQVVEPPPTDADDGRERLDRLLSAGYDSLALVDFTGVRLRVHADPRRDACGGRIVAADALS